MSETFSLVCNSSKVVSKKLATYSGKDRAFVSMPVPEPKIDSEKPGLY